MGNIVNTILFILFMSPTIWAANVTVNSGDLKAVMVDNGTYGTHKSGYNGVSELFHGNSLRNIFDNRYGGMNFEFIVSGDKSSYGWNIFEPRRSPMVLTQDSSSHVNLFQANTENWPLQTSVDFNVTNANALDFTIKAKPLADTWSKHGYIGMFFASYLDSPEDKSLHFIGKSRAGMGDQNRRWIKYSPAQHGVKGIHRPAGSDWDPPADPNHPIPLVTSTSDYEYIYPFYYGISHGKVYLIMFKKPDSLDEIRFGQSPNGAGPTNPAWDFFLIKRNYVVNEEFTFSGRLIYRDHDGEASIIKDYENWSGEKITLLENPVNIEINKRKYQILSPHIVNKFTTAHEHAQSFIIYNGLGKTVYRSGGGQISSNVLRSHTRILGNAATGIYYYVSSKKGKIFKGKFLKANLPEIFINKDF